MVHRTPEEKALVELGRARRKRRDATAAYNRKKRSLIAALTRRETAVDDLCEELEVAHGEAAEALEFLALFYSAEKEQEKAKKIEEEMESLDNDFSNIQNETARLLLTFVEIASIVQEPIKRPTPAVDAIDTPSPVSDIDSIDNNLKSPIDEDFGPPPLPVVPPRDVTSDESFTVPSNVCPRDCSNPLDVGADLYQQLKRVSIPTFSGEKRSYATWKAAFVACIDKSKASPEYKLLQLRQYLKGSALQAIDGLGHSAAAYEAAKSRLERKYGGERRRIAACMEEIESFDQVRPGKAADLDRFADLIDVTIVNLKDAGREAELGNGTFYTLLQKKLPENLLTQYNRWVFEQGKPEGVYSLHTWVNREAEYQAVAAETVRGLDNSVGCGRRERERTTKKASTFHQASVSCPLCKSQHGIWTCAKFLRLNVDERWDLAKKAGVCFRCLRSGHSGRRCESTKPCGVDCCIRTHHKLLHRERTTEQGTIVTHTVQSASSAERNVIALRTVPVVLVNGKNTVQVNALLDDGSTQTYVNKAVAAELGVQAETKSITVNVLNGMAKTFSSMPVEVELRSVGGDFTTSLHAMTTSHVTGDLRVIDWNNKRKNWRHLSSIEFPAVNRKTHVDLLIGLDHPELHSSLAEIRGQVGEPIARLTPLGWTCVGPPDSSSQTPRPFTGYAQSFYVQKDDSELTDVVRKFWSLENYDGVSKRQAVSTDDRHALEIAENTLRFIGGRYEIGLPWKDSTQRTHLPDSYPVALRRLKYTEKTLMKDPEVWSKYDGVIQKYLQQGYIRRTITTTPEQDAWYLPHFPIIKPDRATTKIRIVFDASAQVNGVSLNSLIHAGPKLQNDLCKILVRFRQKPVAVVCDIAEMYLQVGLKEDDRKYQRFLWRASADQEPDIYEFNRVVFGVNASPFLAQHTAQERARRHQQDLPRAAEVVLDSTCMDDCMTSVEDDDTAGQLYKDLSKLWQKAGMHARKWLSNSSAVLEKIRAEDILGQLTLDQDPLPSVKTLGVLWKAELDQFSFNATQPPEASQVTKRGFLKKIATIFDPLGFLSPFTIRARILLQEMWIAGIEWDQACDEDQAGQACDWFAELSQLTEISLPRCLQLSQEIELSRLHVFCDASEHAFGAVVYIEHRYVSGETSSRLVCSKVKVAPLAAVSIPRLELMGAIVALRLATVVASSLGMDLHQVHFWSDSMNVLHWIRNSSRQFKPFVAHRVGEIQTATDSSQWRYVPSKLNPADMLTRGTTVAKLAENSAWWEGPDFIQDELAWPNQPHHKMTGSSQIKCESKASARCFLAFPHQRKTLAGLEPERFSDWGRLVRIQAWVYRFVYNCRFGNQRSTGPLSSDEIRDAETSIIRQVQASLFREEYEALLNQRPLPTHSKLASLNPRLDEDYVLRSQGRLQLADTLSFDARHPILLPRHSRVTTLIVKKFHEELHHVGGTNQTLASLSSRFWIISAREAIHEWERECNRCRRVKVRAGEQIMAPLPVTCITSSLRAFARSSVDYAGPFVTVQGRGRTRMKRYLCLFTCMATRAVHLEMAFDLSTDGFLNAFSRMASRRGLPEEMTSDNGTNFVGANNELRQLINRLDKDRIRQRTADKGITWRFNPPGGPHFGGAHESLIKTAKKALHAILGKADIKDEELLTCFAGVEALMNSRPLTYQSAHPSDDVPLTPNHFLHGQVGGDFAPTAVDNVAFNPRRRWRRVQELLKHFWQRWVREFLPSLASRKKWREQRRNIKVDDVVLVIGQDSPRGEWPLARVVETYPGPDGHVRVAKVQLGRQTLLRPITKLCMLLQD